MSDSPLDLDLKFLPDWLKEPAGKNPYADFAGDTSDRSSRYDSGRRGGPGRPNGSNRPSSRPGPGGGPRDSQGRGNQGRGNQGSQNRGFNRPGPGGKSPSRPNQGGPGRGNTGTGVITIPNRENRENRQAGGSQGQAQARGPRLEAAAEIAVPLSIEFVPEPNGIAALAQQIKAGHRAYPLYGIGRMFLNKPERHRVRITSLAPACPVFQAGENGPVSLNRAQTEREAFRALKTAYYTEETIQNDPPKGNFTNVARCRLSGVLLGPTNHHGYQPALRRLFESRFSRRMDFSDFLRQIEVVNDPAVVEQWKQESSRVTVFRTTQEAEPVEFKSLQEVEAHFRAHYLEKAVRSEKTIEIDGVASRNVNDRTIRDAIRTAWEKERGFPAQIVNHIRPHFVEAGFHIWKHRKRILFVSTVRPVRFGPEARNVSEQIANILNVVESSPKCTRNDLSAKLLKPHEGSEEFPKLKAALASDLHWLIGSGHIIEFHDGTLDLPLAPKDLAKEGAETGKAENAGKEKTTLDGGEASNAAPAADGAQTEEKPTMQVAEITPEPVVEKEQAVEKPESITAPEAVQETVLAPEPVSVPEPEPSEPVAVESSIAPTQEKETEETEGTTPPASLS